MIMKRKLMLIIIVIVFMTVSNINAAKQSESQIENTTEHSHICGDPLKPCSIVNNTNVFEGKGSERFLEQKKIY